ncbi:MAG: hypothetical protein FWE47_00130 [Oscillospiraceae bacterium]|nr:hypothetical protein [Oscillospiraceae bacterium]
MDARQEYQELKRKEEIYKELAEMGEQGLSGMFKDVAADCPKCLNELRLRIVKCPLCNWWHEKGKECLLCGGDEGTSL